MIRYVTNPSLELEDVLALYQAVEWTNYTQQPEMLEKAIKGSLDVLVAFEENRLVGLLRTVGDGASIIFVQDILVLPDYQRQGIGRKLLKTILEKYREMYQLHLLTDRDEKTMSFYESLGMTAVENLGGVAYTYYTRPEGAD